MRSVRFLRGYPPYNSDEVAGFPDDQAAKLCDGDRPVAEYMDGGAGPANRDPKVENRDPKKAPRTRKPKKAKGK